MVVVQNELKFKIREAGGLLQDMRKQTISYVFAGNHLSWSVRMLNFLPSQTMVVDENEVVRMLLLMNGHPAWNCGAGEAPAANRGWKSVHELEQSCPSVHGVVQTRGFQVEDVVQGARWAKEGVVGIL